MLLHSYGLLHASFQPENLARRIRNLTRHREKHLDEASRAIQHMQKSLEQMNVKITNVLSDITGLSGMCMIALQKMSLHHQISHSIQTTSHSP